MLSPTQKVVFLIFALLAISIAAYTWRRLLRRIAAGRSDTDARFDHPLRRFSYALTTTLTQSRTFRKRPIVSFFHSFIFYGFVFYLLVNLVDAAEGYVPFTIHSNGPISIAYNITADILSALVLIGVVALVFRRFALPSRRDFKFNVRTMLHPAIQRGKVRIDSLIVSAFILFHVGSRAVGAGAKLVDEGPDSFQPFATLLSHLFNSTNAHVWREFGYWGALGSVFAFLAYFPYSKHIHIFMAPAKYAVARAAPSGVLPSLVLDMESDTPQLGAKKLEDLAWPRLLDAYACIQCNRCQDVCPATATGKALSPSALEINKRMELNELAHNFPAFESGAPSPRPLLQFALSPEALWACTTCGACLDVCPVQDEPMLDIIDIRRQQVMIEGEFPSQLQTAFRGMERSNNPWGINHEKRMDWAEGLNVKTTETNPNPDVLFWVGCAASYDPQSQKTARAFVQLLDHAGVDFAVLGKRECCTGDSARRAGNEYLYRQLANQNVSTLNEINPKLIVATCPHCMNSVGKEYAQIGGDYKVMHHTQYLESLVADGRLQADSGSATVAFHDPCYLGRHNGVYDAPRNVLNILSNTVVELDRSRENSFCCGAGGAQFWKEEEPGEQRISDNRYNEAERKLAGADEPVLAVGCPFCKSMLDSTPGKGTEPIAVKDIAELLLEGVQRKLKRDGGETLQSAPSEVRASLVEAETTFEPFAEVPASKLDVSAAPLPVASAIAAGDVQTPPVERKKWAPKTKLPAESPTPTEAALLEQNTAAASSIDSPKRKAWKPKAKVAAEPPALSETVQVEQASTAQAQPVDPPKRRTWTPKRPSNTE